ncbi:Hermansky-Pudlak syndrome 3 protein isoform X1 [Polyodon spathula]|uniref:Hermansky-Pudlak syndrome 3 protein isoform X1 n=1 Tax=Polyodon spathula TaxID=7913 RepID=UPI001B7D98CF|nr:Hermansky-Pudlak syndrome 3 protein isoform X1 [Polyodon spathula]
MCDWWIDEKMVHVYNCHPFASQQIVPTDQEPGLFCCGGDALFVVSAGGCRIEVFQLQEEEECTLLCRFATMGKVLSIAHSGIGDYLVTIEEKSKATYLRAYTNWRYQAVEKTRVAVRMLGHFLSGSSFRVAPKEQMEIIEIPLYDPPLCFSCCPVTGHLLVGCRKSLVVFSLKKQDLNDPLSVLDFERSLIMHVPGWTPSQVCFCDGYVAIQMELEILVVKLEHFHQQPTNDNVPVPKDINTSIDIEEKGIYHYHSGLMREAAQTDISQLEQDDFYVCQKNQELLGEEARECGVSVTLERTGMELEAGDIEVSYVLYRRFAPDFFQGHTVEETHLHSLQLLPIFTVTSSQDLSCEKKEGEPLSMFCFISLPNTGYLYSIRNGVELTSTYQYPEKAQQAVLSNQFLHVITRNALQCFTARCSAVAARTEDPYIDTTMKACPPFTMDVCALRIQLFIGLKALCHFKNHVVLLTKAAVDGDGESGRGPKKAQSRKSTSTKQKVSESGHGWNLYIVNTVSTLHLYSEMVEYSKKYETNSPQAQSCIHLLSEAHLLLRAALLDPAVRDPARGELEAAFKESCAQLGDCYSRFDKRDFHLALPYYKMSGLSVTEVIERNVTFSQKSQSFGKGFLFFLKHSLYEESSEELSEETAGQVLHIFSTAEPSQLPHVVCSPCMLHANHATAFASLEKLESTLPSVVVTLTKAAIALKMENLQQYKTEMGCHTEMLQVYGFIEEPKLLLLNREGKSIEPTSLAHHLKETQEGLLVASAVALHENNKMTLEEADTFFKELSRETGDEKAGPQLLVDFWEALLVASTQEAIIQELLFKLSTVYIDRISTKENSGIKPLKTAEDLINSCSHYGLIFPWVSVITPSVFNMDRHYQEDLQKLQSLLSGPSLDPSSIFPLLEQLSDNESPGLSIHVLCATKLGDHESCIDKLLERCPQAIIPYANHELQREKQPLWWQKVLPELCKKTKYEGDESNTFLSSLKETLLVVAMELDPLEFLNLIPDDGTAAFFVPYVLECSQKNLVT